MKTSSDIHYDQSVYVVTAIHNSIEHTKKFIKCIKHSTFKNVKTIILDDGSTDGSFDYISRYNPDILVIKGSGNNWWTEGLNICIRKALSLASNEDYILTINNDCVFDKYYIKKMFEKIQSLKNKAVLSSFECDSITKREVTGYLYNNWQEGKISNNIRPRGCKEVDIVYTKGTIFSVKCIKNIGLLDTKNFPHYASDLEYAARLKRHGYSLYIDSACRVFCDQQRTGINFSSGQQTYKDIIKLMFDKKSSINVIDHFNIIRFIVPNEYKYINYIFLIKKIIYMLTIPIRKKCAKKSQ